MRKLSILILSVLLIASLAPAVLAEPKPGAEYIPQPVDPDPGFTFEDWWIELNPDEGGEGIELPGDTYASGAAGYIRGGVCGFDPYTGTNLCHGLPIGFNFKYMQGPAVGDPVFDEFGRIVDWVVSLSENGYDEAWIGTKGYIAFHEPVADLGEISAIKWGEMPTEVPLPWPPNNMIAPYMTDLAIGDNTFWDVVDVAFFCAWGPNGSCAPEVCNDTRYPAPKYEGPRCCAESPIDGNPGEGFWMPCNIEQVFVPRGRLLYQTVGEEPDRKFVVEWANAKVYWGSGYATFQLQLWEGNNAVLFLYKDFKPLAFYEDPSHDAAFPLWDALVVGMEDYYGKTGVGQAYIGEPDFSPDGWQFVNPLDELTALAFVPDAYAGVRPFVP